MNEKIDIVFAQVLDVKSIVKLVRDSFNEKYLESSIYLCDGIYDFIQIELSNEYSPYQYFIAKSDNKILGFAEFKLFAETKTTFLNIIAVDNNAKGRGVANKIMKHCISYYKNTDYNNIQLDVFKSNTIAKSWYKKIGFTIESTVYYYNHDVNNNFVNKQKFTIENLSQFSTLIKIYGFSFIQIKNSNKATMIGVINKSLIVKNEVISESILSTLLSILKAYNIDKVFYIGPKLTKRNYNYLDEIHRMKLIC